MYTINPNLLIADENYKALCMAASSKNYYKALQIVDEVREIDLYYPRTYNHQGITPLFIAAMSGSFSIFKLILRKSPGSINFFYTSNIRRPKYAFRTIIWKSIAEECMKDDERASKMFSELGKMFVFFPTDETSVSLAYEFKNAFRIVVENKTSDFNLNYFPKEIREIIEDYAGYSLRSTLYYRLYESVLGYSDSLGRITTISRIFGVYKERNSEFAATFFEECQKHYSIDKINKMRLSFQSAMNEPLSPPPISTSRAVEVREKIRSKASSFKKNLE